MENFEKSQKQKNIKHYIVPCYLWLAKGAPCGQDITPLVQNLYSERWLSIQTIVGTKRKKNKISPFPATHAYIKLTLVSFFPFFWHLSLRNHQLFGKIQCLHSMYGGVKKRGFQTLTEGCLFKVSQSVCFKWFLWAEACLPSPIPKVWMIMMKMLNQYGGQCLKYEAIKGECIVHWTGKQPHHQATTGNQPPPYSEL